MKSKLIRLLLDVAFVEYHLLVLMLMMGVEMTRRMMLLLHGIVKCIYTNVLVNKSTLKAQIVYEKDTRTDMR